MDELLELRKKWSKMLHDYDNIVMRNVVPESDENYEAYMETVVIPKRKGVIYG